MVRLVEVGPRDGLQNEATPVPTEVKVAFVDALSEAGFDEIEVSSFVSARWIPQLADAEEVFARIRRAPGVTYMALVPNLQGLTRARAARVDKVAVFTAASETFSRKNTNATIAETLERFRPVVAEAGVPGPRLHLHCISLPLRRTHRSGPGAFGREVAPRAGRESSLSIGDTIGKATPDEVKRLLEVLLPAVRA